MSIASEITRLQGVKADILTAIGNKGVTVPAGSALDDCPDLITSIEGDYTPIQGSVELFGKVYDTIKINGLEWICQNLDYKWSELLIGHNTSTQQACYVNDDENTWGWNGRKCGLLYNNAAMKYLQENILVNSEWRVCTIDDLGKLASSTNDYFNTGFHLVSDETWSTIRGDDKISFKGKPCGALVESDGSVNVGSAIYINTYTNNSKCMTYYRPTEENTGIFSFMVTIMVIGIHQFAYVGMSPRDYDRPARNTNLPIAGARIPRSTCFGVGSLRHT